MKNRIIITALIVIVFSSCTSLKYLPTTDKIDVNEFGSYINFTQLQLHGELIAIDSTKIIVLTENAKKCVTISVGDVKEFSLRYAKAENSNFWYAALIPLFATTISHGFGMYITVPVNLIVTVSVIKAGERGLFFMYNEKNMTYDKLKMFARFPQGVPPGIDLESIK